LVSLLTEQAKQDRFWRAIVSWAIFLTAETTTQIVFKVAGADLDLDAGLSPMLAHAIASPWVWAGFGLYFVDFLLWMLILKESDLGRAFPLSSLVYVTSLIAAVTLFHERTNLIRIIGLLTIMAGVAVLSADENTETQPPSPSGRGPASQHQDSH